MGYIDDLSSELSGNPVGMAYTGDDEGDAAILNDRTKRTEAVTTMTAAELWEVFDYGELDLKSDTERLAVDRMLSLGHNGEVINFASGSNALLTMNGLFLTGDTADALTAVLSPVSISRAEELKFPTVKAGHCQEARR